MKFIYRSIKLAVTDMLSPRQSPPSNYNGAFRGAVVAQISSITFVLTALIIIRRLAAALSWRASVAGESEAWPVIN